MTNSSTVVMQIYFHQSINESILVTSHDIMTSQFTGDSTLFSTAYRAKITEAPLWGETNEGLPSQKSVMREMFRAIPSSWFHNILQNDIHIHDFIVLRIWDTNMNTSMTWYKTFQEQYKRFYFALLCCVVAMRFFVDNSVGLFTHNLYGYFTDTETITLLPQYQWNNPNPEEVYAYLPTPKCSYAQTICIHFYCLYVQYNQYLNPLPPAFTCW